MTEVEAYELARYYLDTIACQIQSISHKLEGKVKDQFDKQVWDRVADAYDDSNSPVFAEDA